MPSSARRRFRDNLCADVELLIAQHRQEFRGRGRPLSVFTRSGVFLLCAAWEVYCEDVILEGNNFLLDRFRKPDKLPKGVMLRIGRANKEEKSEISSLKLAGNGWKSYAREIASSDVGALNTPKVGNLIPLFERYVGVDLEEFFRPHGGQIEEFVSKRGDIAHRGANAGHISIDDLEQDFEFIKDLVRSLDNELSTQLNGIAGRRPWNHGAR